MSCGASLPAARRSPWRWRLALLPPLLAGCALRGYRVREQILMWDELHTVRAALEMPLRQIFRSWMHETGDHSVPLTAFYHALMGRGVALSEMGFRAPVLLAGALGLLVIPIGLAPRIGRRAALVLAWLLALSPTLVLYGRIVRSYVPMVLLAFAAAVGFERWWRTRARTGAAVYVACGALAVYFHLGAGPFVLAPLVYATGALCVRRRGGRDARALALVAGCLALAIAGLLFPARDSLLELARSGRGGALPDAGTWLALVRLQSGTSCALLAAVLVAAAVRGAWLLYRRDRAFLAYLLTLAGVQVAGLVLLAPVMLEQLLVVHRYLLVWLPFGLALAASGLAAPWGARTGRRAGGVQALAIAALLLALFATGPLASAEFRSTQFVHHPRFLELDGGVDWLRRDAVPHFYLELAARGDERGEGLVEYPWLNLGRALYGYQTLHRRPLHVAPPGFDLADPRLALRHFVAPTPEAFLASGARYVVVHRDLRAEERRVVEGVRLRGRRALWGAARERAARMAARLRAEWGEPVFSDESIEVWDLAPQR